MRRLFILTVYFCAAGLLTFLGVLMLISSDSSLRLLYKFLPAEKSSRPYTSWSAWSQVRWRLRGFFMTVFGLCMLLAPIYALLNVVPTKQGVAVAPLPAVMGRSISVATLLALFVFGLYLAMKPKGIVWLSKMMMPNRTLPNDAPPSGYVAVRVIGACLVASAIYCLEIVLRR